jgi:hypothetical protein
MNGFRIKIKKYCMKKVLSLIFVCLASLSSFSQASKESISTPDPGKSIQIAEVACGECKFGLPGKSCDLAIRIDGKSYFVDGTEIDSHGDAHAKDGFCNAISRAEVQGEVLNDRYKVTYFKLIKPDPKAKP